MSPEQLQSFIVLALGFAFAGVLATGYQCVTARPASEIRGLLGSGAAGAEAAA